MAGLPLPSNSFVYKRVAGTDPAANTEIGDTVPVAVNEVQTITGTPSATFALTVDGVTGPVSLTTTATAQNVQDYLNALTPYSSGAGVVCTGGPLPGTITVTYSGTGVAAKNVSAPTVAGGVTGLTITTTTQGSQAKSWWLLSVSVALVQGITQTPQPVLQIQDPSNNVIFDAIGSTAAQAVSTTCQYTWAGDVQLTGQVGSAANVHSNAPLPQNLVIGPGFQIKTSTVGIGANTNYGAPSYYVIEFTN
jgi:hypothetical protein